MHIVDYGFTSSKAVMRFSATGHLMISNNVIRTMYVCVCVAVVEVVIWDYFVYQNYV